MPANFEILTLFLFIFTQTLQEITDVADHFSKIARDKFIPIREEEERIYSASPIIQVRVMKLLSLSLRNQMLKDTTWRNF